MFKLTYALFYGNFSPKKLGWFQTFISRIERWGGARGYLGKMDEKGELSDYIYVNYLTDFDRGDMFPPPAPHPS